MGLKEHAKTLVRVTVGVWPAFEMRNSVTTIVPTLRNRRFEAAEIQRLRQQTRPSCRVLVVIPTYRRPEQVQVAIRSALAQTLEGVRLVVVADGTGLEGVPAFDRVLAVTLSRNTGTAGLVRNIGMGLIDSDFVAFLDDDNTWDPDHLETLMATLQSHPKAPGAYTSVRRMRPDGTIYDTLDTPFDRSALRNTAYVDVNSLMIRRSRNSRFSDIPRTRNTLPGEDWEFVWRLSRSHPLIHIDRATVNYTINRDSYFTDWSGPNPPW